MNDKKTLQQLKAIPFLVTGVRAFRRLLGVTPEMLDDKYHKKRAEALSNFYFNSSHGKHRLHIGCQTQLLTGWLNVDIEPKSTEVMYLDARVRFPFPDQSFDYIYSEHMIEHISYSDGLFMLRECFRCLKKNGRIRLATPDFEFLIGLASDRKSEIETRYINYSVRRHLPEGTPINHVFVVNNFFKDWGHKFIYDFSTISESLRKCGFDNIEKCEVGFSSDIELRDLEHHGNEIGEDFNKLETMVVEAMKL